MNPKHEPAHVDAVACARITFWSALVTTAILVVASLSMIAIQRRQLIANTDDILAKSFVDLGSATVVGPGFRGGRNEPEVPPTSPPERLAILLDEFANSTDRALQILDSEGEVIASSRSLERLDSPLVSVDEIDFDAPISIGSPSSRLSNAVTVSADDTRYRVIVGKYGSDNFTRYAVIAEPLRDVDRALALQAAALAISVPALIALLAGLIWVVAGRALKPVEAIRREVDTITGEDLHRRVPVPTNSHEIEGLANTMNSMLDRLDRSAASQRQFIDDASHELRSPIAGVRGLLEVNLAHPEVAEWDESGREMLDETIRMQHLVDDLMTLARGTAANTRRTDAFVDLDDIVLAESDRLRRDTTLTINVANVSAAQVIGDGDELTRVVRNLTNNAARHATSTIWLSLVEQDSDVELVVTDDGPGIDDAMAERIFERFTRLDEARARDAGGSGLGLAIVKAIVERHGGSIVLDTTHSPGARFVVCLPRDGAESSRPREVLAP
ncbi:MAG: HAMP domain-containing sensor histidine kinase [Acidimicrobiales bacterium]